MQPPAWCPSLPVSRGLGPVSPHVLCLDVTLPRAHAPPCARGPSASGGPRAGRAPRGRGRLCARGAVGLGRIQAPSFIYRLSCRRSRSGERAPGRRTPCWARGPALVGRARAPLPGASWFLPLALGGERSGEPDTLCGSAPGERRRVSGKLAARG